LFGLVLQIPTDGFKPLTIEVMSEILFKTNVEMIGEASRFDG
jgi:hypothetical protein